MPCIIIQSNVKLEEAKQKDLLADMSKNLSKTLGKPEAYVMVGYQNAAMVFGGVDTPCVFAQLNSIGQISVDKNEKTSAVITGILVKHLNVSADRVYITFNDVKPSNWGFNGSTF